MQCHGGGRQPGQQLDWRHWRERTGVGIAAEKTKYMYIPHFSQCGRMLIICLSVCVCLSVSVCLVGLSTVAMKVTTRMSSELYSSIVELATPGKKKGKKKKKKVQKEHLSSFN